MADIYIKRLSHFRKDQVLYTRSVITCTDNDRVIIRFISESKNYYYYYYCLIAKYKSNQKIQQQSTSLYKFIY